MLKNSHVVANVYLIRPERESRAYYKKYFSAIELHGTKHFNEKKKKRYKKYIFDKYNSCVQSWKLKLLTIIL
jgi:hypothetical protein